MDEALQDTSRSVRITRKSDHPFLSLISTSPRPRSTSPLTSEDPASSLSLFLNDEKGRRTEKFYVAPLRSPRRGTPIPAPQSAVSSSDSGFLSPNVSGLAKLFRIPEEQEQHLGSPSSSSALQAGEVENYDEDLEAPLLPGERSRPNNEENHDNRGISVEPLTDDAEEANEERDDWRKSGVTGFLLSALPLLPEVLNPFSSSPEDHHLVSSEGECVEHGPEEQNRGTRWTRSALPGLLYSSIPLLPEIINPFSSSTDERLPDHPPTPRSPARVAKGLSKDDGEVQSVPNLEGFNLPAYLEKRGRRILHKCRTAPVLNGCSVHSKEEPSTQPSTKVIRNSASYVVWHATMGLCTYLCVGVIIYIWKRDEFSGIETVGVVDALYFCIVTMCTIGYGDITPNTPATKIMSVALVFVGFGFIDALLTGMVSFVLDRQEHLLLTVVEDGHHERAKSYVMDSKKGRMRIRMKVALAILTVFLSIVVGVVFFHNVEDLNWIDAIYVTCLSITTVGYGDVSFQTKWGRLFAAVWLLLSTVGVARAFLFLAEARVHRRHRRLARRVLERKVTTDDLMSMDLDNDGHISKSEFVVYKLKEMGKIQEGDVVEICKQFDFLDSLNAGKITLTQLLDGEQ